MLRISTVRPLGLLDTTIHPEKEGKRLVAVTLGYHDEHAKITVEVEIPDVDTDEVLLANARYAAQKALRRVLGDS